MTNQQEVILMQLLHKIAAQGDHTSVDLQLIEALQRLAERQQSILDVVVVLVGKVTELRDVITQLREGQPGDERYGVTGGVV